MTEEAFKLPDQHQLSQQFHELHHAKEMLILANAWDAVSAKIFERAGFPAIATTSSGISWSCGYRDVEHIPPATMIGVIERIARSVAIPVTADIEGGYFRNDNKKLLDFFSDVIGAGAVGINLEDSDNHQTGNLIELKTQCERIKIARKASESTGIDLFINARTDAMARTDQDLDTRIALCIERAKAFEDAGADGIFIPFINDIGVVEELKSAIRLPLNILGTTSLDVGKLREAGVNRVSVGSRPILSAMNLLMRIAKEMRSGDQWKNLFTNEPGYQEANSWFS